MLSDVYFGEVGKEIDWRDEEFEDLSPDDDEELVPTPSDVVDILGFDPRDEDVAKAGNGIMIAWFPPKELADKLAQEGGEKPEELHVTLAYLGKQEVEKGKGNPCHTPGGTSEGGQFCGTSSELYSRQDAEKYIQRIGFAKEVDLDGVEEWRAISLARNCKELRKQYPKAPPVQALLVSDFRDGKTAGQYSIFGEIELDSSLFKSGGPGARATLTHEFGHHLDASFSHRSEFLIGAKKENPHREIVASAYKGNWKLTEYAKTSPTEMLAEAFVDYQIGGRRLVGPLAELKTVFADWKKGREWTGTKMVQKSDQVCSYPFSAAVEWASLILGEEDVSKSLTNDQIQLLKDTVENYCKRFAPLQGTLGGNGRFPATPSSDDKDVLIKMVDVALLEKFREELIEELADKGIPIVRNHGYTPHMTLAYVDPDYKGECMHPDVDDIIIDALTVAVGGERHVYPLNGEEVLKAARDNYDYWLEKLAEILVSGSVGKSNPCHEASGSKGGQFCSTGGSNAAEPPSWTQTRMWRGDEVDAELSDSVLNGINKSARAYGNVTSMCNGHPRGESGVKAGQTPGPAFGIDIHGRGQEATKQAEALATRLRSEDTTVATHYWGGPNGNWVTHSDGKLREGVFDPTQIAQIKESGIKRAVVVVHSNLLHDGKNQKELRGWWDTVNTRLGGEPLVKILKVDPTTSQVHSDKPLTDEEKKRKQVKKPDLEVEFNMEQESIDLQGEIVFKAADRQQVFGWASVISKNENGVQVPIADTQGDVISADELEKTAYSFVLNCRDAGEMHIRKGVGKLIESVVLTVEKAKAMGIELPGGTEGWWTGWAISDGEVWKRVKSGELRSLSIHGKGIRSKILE